MALEALAPGALFAGDYRVVRPLAAGGMGAVYVAQQISTGKQRALKVMLPGFVAQPDLRRRFEQEARAGANIASEHVVEVYAAGVDPQTGVPYLVMELLVGEDLGTRIRSRGPLAPVEAKLVFDQLSHGLAAAHAAGVVHRDLKPENVFLAQSNRADVAFTVKILDFGIAKLLAEGTSSSTSSVGTPLWLAPEQTDSRPVTPATDVWSLGLVAFTAITGKYYWRCTDGPNATVSQVMREILVDPMPFASQRAAALGCALPAGFDAWFHRCVARDPTTRFQNAAEAGAGLAALWFNAPAPLTSAPQLVPMAIPLAMTMAPAYGGYPPRTEPSSMMKPLLIAGAIIGGVFLLAGVETMLWLHEHDDDPPASKTDAGADARAAMEEKRSKP